jgi:hypothetical protein
MAHRTLTRRASRRSIHWAARDLLRPARGRGSRRYAGRPSGRRSRVAAKTYADDQKVGRARGMAPAVAHQVVNRTQSEA